MEVEKTSMPYREKSAWLSLTAIVVTFVPYFTLIGLGVAHGDAVPNFPRLGLLATTLITQMVLMAGGHAYLAIKSPEEAKAPPDERDRAIMYLSMTWAYYVLMSLIIMVGCVAPFYSGGWKIINGTLFSIQIAELVHYGVVARCYRRQA